MSKNEYIILDRATGQEIPFQLFIDKAISGGWQKVFIPSLVEMLKSCNGGAVNVIATLLQHKDHKNVIRVTIEQLTTRSGSSRSTVKRIINSLKTEQMIKQAGSGCLMLNPNIIRTGNDRAAAMMFKIWSDLK